MVAVCSEFNSANTSSLQHWTEYDKTNAFPFLVKLQNNNDLDSQYGVARTYSRNTKAVFAFSAFPIRWHWELSSGLFLYLQTRSVPATKHNISRLSFELIKRSCGITYFSSLVFDCSMSLISFSAFVTMIKSVYHQDCRLSKDSMGGVVWGVDEGWSVHSFFHLILKT